MLLNIFATAAIWKFLVAHQLFFGFVASWLISAYAAKGMADPTPTSSRAYQFWYYLVHSAAGNIDKWKQQH